MNLKNFNYYQHLKKKIVPVSTENFLIVDDEIYNNHNVSYPFRSTHYGIGINYGNGSVKCKIGGEDYSLLHSSLITIGPGIVSQWQQGDNLRNITVFFDENLFSELNVSFLKGLSFFLHGANHVIYLTENDLKKITALFMCIKSFSHDEGIVSGLIFSLIKYITQIHRSSSQRTDLSIKEQLTYKFKEALGKHFIESKEVHFYASKLNKSPKYLSEVLFTVTGKSAKEHINEHIIWEAKSLLKQTEMTIQEIAYWLGYKDLSYFVRMFKKKTNLTPLQYRND